MAAHAPFTEFATVEWTEDGLRDLYAHAFDHGKCGAFFIERFEHGIPWTMGLATYSTGVNGTHHTHLDAGKCRDAEEMARLTIEVTKEFPSWRIVEIDGGLNGIYGVKLYGGKYQKISSAT